MGEPSGVGGELTLKTWLARHENNIPPFFTIDQASRLRDEAKTLNFDVPVQEIQDPQDAINIFENALPVLNIDLPEKPVAGEIHLANGKAVLESIEKSVQLCVDGQTSAMVTNPIHKAALKETGFQHPGHTEYIAHLVGKGETPLMMLATEDLPEDLRVVPLTIHHALREIPDMITPDLIAEALEILHKALRGNFSLKDPVIAVAGLNPHAGESGQFGREEIEIIAPVLDQYREQGWKILGPMSADTMFHEEARAKYDAALCMYHDQALIPLKTLDFHNGVNTTLGLSLVRTSPDHGTALDIAGKGIADPRSFMAALKLAEKMAQRKEK